MFLKLPPAAACSLLLALSPLLHAGEGTGLEKTNLSGQAPPTGRFPDLEAKALFAPELAYVGQDVPVSIDIRSLGDQVGVNYLAEIVLSSDFVIDPGDTLVATVNNMVFGPQNVTASLPVGMAQGTYNWGLRVYPLAGETDNSNNIAFAGPCVVHRTALQLDDPADIIAFARINDPTGPVVTVRVDNIGTDDSSMLFQVEQLDPAPWLVIDPDSGSADAGVEGQDVNLNFHHEGLPPGDYMTTVRFNNLTTPDDFQELNVTLSVGEARFVPGDRIMGLLADSSDADTLVFDAVKGMKLELRTRVPVGNLALRVTLIDPDGGTEEVVKFKNSTKLVNKLVKLKKSGEYTMLIGARNGTSGIYRVRTGGELPKKARPYDFKMLSPLAGGGARAKVLILRGATLEFILKPNGRFAGPLTMSFETPGGGLLDLSGNTTPGPGTSVLISGLELSETGPFVLELGGFGADDRAKVNVRVMPVQPPHGTSRIYMN